LSNIKKLNAKIVSSGNMLITSSAFENLYEKYFGVKK